MLKAKEYFLGMLIKDICLYIHIIIIVLFGQKVEGIHQITEYKKQRIETQINFVREFFINFLSMKHETT